MVESVQDRKNAWAIREQLSAIANACTSEDVFICYFSGHGILRQGELFLLLDSTKIDNTFHTALPVSFIREVLKFCQAHSKLLILDCCHAGASVDKTGLKAELRIPIEEVIDKPDNHLVLLASSRIEEAREIEELKGSFLTHYIVAALTTNSREVDKDEDGRVSIDDLRRWLHDKSVEHNQRHPQWLVPTPYVYGQMRGDFFLTISKIPWPWLDITGIKTAHTRGYKGHGAIVCLLGTGCDADHEQLKHVNIDFQFIPLDPTGSLPLDVAGFDLDRYGTHSCGIIAGRDIGIAPHVELIVATVAGGGIGTSLARLVFALNWMLSILMIEQNLSKPFIIVLPFEFIDLNNNQHQLGVVSSALHQIIRTLVIDYDALVIVGSGAKGSGHINMLAKFPEVLAVGAVDNELSVADFSGSCPAQDVIQAKPDVVGLGVDVVSSIPRGGNRRSRYETRSGTSVAAAYVAGIAALYGSMTGLSGLSLRQKLIETALQLTNREGRTGSGLVRFIL